MHMSGNNFTIAIDNADKGLIKFFAGAAQGINKARCGARSMPFLIESLFISYLPKFK